VSRVVVVATVAAALLASGLGVAAAASLTVQSAHLVAAAATTPVMYPRSVAFTAGTTAGRVEKSDTVTLVWSQPVDEPTLCSGWANSSSSQSIALTWTVTPGSGSTNDTLAVGGTVPATCSSGFHVGTVDLGARGYVSSTPVSFTSSTTSLSVGTTTTLTVTLGTQSGTGIGTVSSGTAATWTPAAALRDRSARSCGANLASSLTTVQF
jgi:hypothetical protein